ncbi:DUF3102 domain-containing protein [Cytobacillus sp. FSL K6-0265]|uniref:DUF3102 domain-containing protein n=1 Tax=Cytobacillus sp. FSL K6-0265 TaxID=2921448 RepID=UPI0030F51666
MTTTIKFGGDVSNELSDDLVVITSEINAYQRVAGEAIFEIGKRLKHVKENGLARGGFGKWLESVSIQRQAQRLMKVQRSLDQIRPRGRSYLSEPYMK